MLLGRGHMRGLGFDSRSNLKVRCSGVCLKSQWRGWRRKITTARLVLRKDKILKLSEFSFDFIYYCYYYFNNQVWFPNSVESKNCLSVMSCVLLPDERVSDLMQIYTLLIKECTDIMIHPTMEWHPILNIEFP